ncbi:MAG TPA: hypothetical protein VMA83_00535 [Solirubrobacteraceae bacterium]|nr:hypothetical protein [Solirubrobacteraceae bacterium]
MALIPTAEYLPEWAATGLYIVGASIILFGCYLVGKLLLRVGQRMEARRRGR